jgi:hypothetical protein
VSASALVRGIHVTAAALGNLDDGRLYSRVICMTRS